MHARTPRLVVMLALALATGCGAQDQQTSGGGLINSAGEPGTSGAPGGGSGAEPSVPGQGAAGGSGKGTSDSTGGGGAAGEGNAAAPGGWDDYGSGSDATGGDPVPPMGMDAGSSYDAGSGSEEDAGQGGDSESTCNTTDPVVLYLSADDSNSMAGATIARGLIAQGQYVTKAVRTYEMLNYYGFAYPAAEVDHVAVSAQMRDAKDGAYSLQIGVRAPDFDAAARRRVNLVLAVDTSSSMDWAQPGQTGMDRARQACLALVSSLEEGDVFSLLTWGGVPQKLVESKVMTGKDDGTLAAQCEALEADGTTDLSAGLAAAYALAKAGFADDRVNRVVLVSDGGANVGETDAKLIGDAAKDANGEAIYLMGVGVGDPWNYNDRLMNEVTDAGKGAYVFLDDSAEAWQVFGDGFLRHVEVAARDVQVELTLPPTFGMKAFHGEEYSSDPKEVEPQHLAANDAMIFHQVISSCDPDALTGTEMVTVKATWEDPITREERVDTFEASFAELLAGDTALLRKGDAVVAYAEALKDVMSEKGEAAKARIDEGIAAIEAGLAELQGDEDLEELRMLLLGYRKVFEAGQQDRWPTGGTGAEPITDGCDCKGTGDTLGAMACALDLCDKGVVLANSYSSPTGASTQGTWAAVNRYGSGSNDLGPQVGKSYAVMATGPALGTEHSQDMGGGSGQDLFVKGSASMHDAMEWKLDLQAPPGANGIRFRYVFFSQEYEDYVGTQYNDKFYAVLQAGSTDGGAKTVINQTECRDPDNYYDMVCSPGMQFCNPRQRYCYIAINTALSECCWLGGCPNGKATTDIAGTGFSCAENQSMDSASSGSSTGWLMTEWPIEPGEKFTLTFHLHDTGDGIFDSAVILDGLQFVSSVTPGTWRVSTVQ